MGCGGGKLLGDGGSPAIDGGAGLDGSPWAWAEVADIAMTGGPADAGSAAMDSTGGATEGSDLPLFVGVGAGGAVSAGGGSGQSVGPATGGAKTTGATGAGGTSQTAGTTEPFGSGIGGQGTAAGQGTGGAAGTGTRLGTGGKATGGATGSSTGGAPGTGGMGTGGDIGTGGTGSSDGSGGTDTVGTGGTDGTGGTGTGGHIGTGGSDGTGGRGNGGATGNGGETAFGFFVFSDAHATNSGVLATAVAQMGAIDSKAIAAFGTGDHTLYDNSSEWRTFGEIIGSGFDTAANAFGGSKPRYLGIVGNHDVMANDWYEHWTSNLTGQTELGSSSPSGVYYATTYRNALFVARDSEHISSSWTSYDDEQTSDLASVLTESSATFKFLFFHEAVYSCTMGHSGFAGGLPWVDLAEQHDVDVVFTGHTHVYSRTCRMKRGRCTDDRTGTVLVETGTVGTTPRTLDRTRDTTVTGTDAVGYFRSDTYNCTDNTLFPAKNATNDFCYVRIDGCAATVSCYAVGAGNTAPFDTWTLDHCPPD